MRKLLHLVLVSALLACGLNLKAQNATTPNIKVDRGENFTFVKILDSYNWPYDISENKQHVVIQGFGAVDGYYWSEKTGCISLVGYPFAVSDEGLVAGTYMNGLGMNVAGLWSPETKTWEFLGMNPDMPEFSTVEGDTDYNGAWSMSNDGNFVGIMQIFPDWSSSSYLWTRNEGYKKLSNGVSNQTRPNAVSDNGEVVAGLAAHETKGEWTPCYWVNGEIHRFPHFFGEALNVSHNGNYICGYLLNDNGFIYDITNDKFVEVENTLEVGNKLSATCVTDNGIIFGYSDAGSPIERNAFAYVGGELMYFTKYLELNGIEEAVNWNIYSVTNVTSDGNTFIGAGVIDGEECSFVLTIESTACEAPKNLTYTIEQPNYNYITLNWEAPENAENVTYNIYLNYTGAPFAEGLTETTFTLDNMDAGEYQFLVRANYNNGECISDISNMVRPTVYPCAENNKCELVVVAYDYYSDGWDNGYISIKGSLSDLEYTVKLSDGGDPTNPEIITLNLCPDTYQFTWVDGNWDEEIKFDIYFQNEELYSINFGDIDETFKKKPTFFEYELNCLAAPKNLRAYVRQDVEDFDYKYEVTMAWDAVEGADGYDIFVNTATVQDYYMGYTNGTAYVAGTNNEGTLEFYVVAFNDEMESDPSEVYTIVIQGEAIEELTSSFDIYPSPAKDKLFVTTNEKIETISIYTITGVMVYNEQCTMNNVQLNVTNLNSGIYFIKINTKEGEMVKRFVKE